MRQADFIRYLDSKGITITQAYLCQMLKEKRPPGPKFRQIFEEITGVRLVEGLVEDRARSPKKEAAHER